MPMLSVIIVTWNGLKHLPRCVQALTPQLPPDAEIVLVDNGSIDGTQAWVRQHAPHVRLIELERNTGFAGGVAVGTQAARGEWLLLLNDDAFVEPNCIDRMTKVLAYQPEIGAVGGVLVFAHRPDLVASAGISVERNAVATDLWMLKPTIELASTPVEIIGPSGGLALYRRALLDDVGGFEPSFFAYLEDLDLAWRLQLRGWRALVVPGARAQHVYSATSGQYSPLKQRLLARNRIRAIVRCLPTALLLRLLPQILMYDGFAVAYALLRRQPNVVAGRLDALAELPELLRQRRYVQKRRKVAVHQLMRWFGRTAMPWQTLQVARQLDTVLRERKDI